MGFGLLLMSLGLPVAEPFFGDAWYLKNTGQTVGRVIGRSGADIGFESVYLAGKTGNRAVRVAILSTGIDWTSLEFENNLMESVGEAGFASNNGLDDDLNGYVDDVHGFNFVSGNANTRDDVGLGTGLASIIGAEINGEAAIGVSPEVSLFPVKVGDRAGSFQSGVLPKALTYAVESKADIIVFGGEIAWDDADLHLTMSQHEDRLFILPAGDRSINLGRYRRSPIMRLPNVLIVGASNSRDAKAGQSNFGEQVHVAAPGFAMRAIDIWDGEQILEGTVAAAGVVAGVAAQTLAEFPALKGKFLRNRILQSSDRLFGLMRFSDEGRRVNLAHAVFGTRPVMRVPLPENLTVSEVAIESPHPPTPNSTFVIDHRVEGAEFMRLRFFKTSFRSFYVELTVEDHYTGEILENIGQSWSSRKTAIFQTDWVDIRLKWDSGYVGGYYGYKIDQVESWTLPAAE